MSTTEPAPAPTKAGPDETPPPAKPLAPTDSIAGRSLVIVIAIMTFLAALAAGAALLVADASAEWRKDAAGEMSVQVKVMDGRDVEADVARVTKIVAAAPGVHDIRVYTKAESEALLAPWLGQGLDLAELPTPRMIVLRVDPRHPPNLVELRQDLASGAPSAVLDDHRLWLERLSQMAGAVVALAGMIFILILAAMTATVASATRAAVATNREIIEVLHLVGAADEFISREYRKRFWVLGLRGASIGGGGAAAFFVAARFVARSFVATPGGDQIEALFGTVSLDARGFAVIFLLSAAVAFATGVLSRHIVLRRLREIH
jgi:cell division transport system permease protein